MDRLFVLQTTYVQDRYNPDGVMAKHLLNQFANMYGDTFMEMPDFPSVHPTLLDAERKGKRVIPIGSLEFVQDIMRMELNGEDCVLEPLEIPEGLRRFAGRKYSIEKGSNIPLEILRNGKQWFIKDASKLKSWNNALNETDCSDMIIPNRNYVVSERVVFESEYRVYVLNDQICGVQLYQGDPTLLVDRTVLFALPLTFLSQCRDRPKAYCFDLGITQQRNETLLIEVHPFVACGLYGFYDPCLLDMWDGGYQWYVDQNQKRIHAKEKSR